MPSPAAGAAPIGVLLINLGTPDAPTTKAVRRYLREFLSDPRVIDIPALGRWLLLNLIILPLRPRRSAEAYKKIWGPQGSPLLAHTLSLGEKLQGSLGAGYVVKTAMRYGSPSIAAARDGFLAAGVSRVIVAPLYPQYASSSTGTALQEVYTRFGEAWNALPLTVLGDFFDEPAFIKAQAALARSLVKEGDEVLFSFHGLPERQVKRSGGEGCFQSSGCCERISIENRFCYRAQCYATARALAAELGLGPDRYSVSFQSRLGRTPWIKPYTDEVLAGFAKAGKKRVVVFCPAFVADCLETLEEIGIRERAAFQSAGGGELILVPCLNDRDEWAAALARWVRDAHP